MARSQPDVFSVVGQKFNDSGRVIIMFILEKAIDDLPAKYKTIYMLREVEGMKIAEISSCLKLTESNVKVRIHRSRQMLKDKLYKLSFKPNVFEFGFSKCDALVNNVMNAIN